MKKIKSVLIVLFALFVVGSAQASFDGQTVQATYYFPDIGNIFDQQQAVVGPGVEFTNFPTNDPRTNIDFSATNIYITYNSASSWTNAAFNGEFFNSETPMAPITDVTINAATNMVGLDESRIAFTENSVSINWNGLAFDTSTIVSLDVEFGSVEPVPATDNLALILLILALGTMGMFGLRRTIKS